jgi:glycosyltransferase involved in cell wall biosynthesis
LVKEVRKVLDWFKKHGSPDALFLSTVMLAGIGKVLRRELEIPVYGFLQGEDSFLDSLLPEYRNEAWKLLSADVAQLDGCIAPSRYFGDFMADRLELDEQMVRHHPNGITLAGFEPEKAPPVTPAIGYLARLCPLKGLDILVDAFIILKETDGFPDLRLEIAGGMTAEDEPFVDEQRRKLAQAGLSDCSRIRPNVDRKDKLDFLGKLSVFSVPARYPEAFGLYVIEALAAGVPVVLPESGAFPELVEQTQGGCIYQPNEPDTLAEALEPLLRNPEQAKTMGLAGHESVSRDFSNEQLAKRLVDNVLSPLKRHT